MTHLAVRISVALAASLAVVVACGAHAQDGGVAAPAPTVTAAEGATTDVITLKSGRKLEGEVLKRTDKRVWLDVGADVLVFDMSDVAEVMSGTSGAPVRAVEQSLYSIAVDLPELSPKEHAKIIGPAVIKVSTPSGLGSGVIIHRDGFAITNAHVVQGETNLRATIWVAQPDGSLRRTELSDVELIAVNNQIDLALVKLKSPDGSPFPIAPIVGSDALEVGQPVFAIGNPLGLERTLTQGVVSTTSRNFDGLTYIQTDTPINPGNSGGPLFNTRGEVVGITNMGIRGGEALGFAIPARYVTDFIRNREAFAYDKNNPNSGHNYLQPPPRKDFNAPPQLRDASSR
jgi:serine protease Do